MIKNKSNICELINEMRNFSYEKDTVIIDVELKTEESMHIRCYDEKCIIINYYEYEEGISALYKDRKYINKVLFQ